MSKTLIAPDGASRNVGVTTTTKMAERILAAAGVVSNSMPRGFDMASPLNILLELYVAEETANYLHVSCLKAGAGANSYPTVVRRWAIALAEQGLIDRQGELLALTNEGHALVLSILRQIFDAQRTLD